MARIPIAVVLAVALGALASDANAQQVSDADIVALIAALKSENPPPKTVNDPRLDVYIEFPKGYDFTKQKKVIDAYKKLQELGLRVFPTLIEHANDKGYSLTREYGTGFCYNDSVGDSCWAILRSQLQPFGSHPEVGGDDPTGKPGRPSYVGSHLGSQEDARNWWKDQTGRSLARIQYEVLDWIIAEEAKRPTDFHPDEHAVLKRHKSRIMETGKPLPTGTASVRGSILGPK